jgi:galactonate dehydratase
MHIAGIDAYPVRLARDHDAAVATAGSPARLTGEAEYRWAATYPCLYSTAIETALVRVRLDNGVEGWGEAQAPVAPEVACTIVERILRAALVGAGFTPSQAAIASLWDRMYATMRVRGQTGGFMLDAIAGVDLALWDLAGKLTATPASLLLGARRDAVPAYLSGIPGERWDEARAWRARGVRSVKVYHAADINKLLSDVDRASEIFGRGSVAVDALWRLNPDSAVELCRELEVRNVAFLECPFPPEEHAWYARLASRTELPIAAGESYRSRYELRPLMESRAIAFVQPDLGRCGITEGLLIAEMAQQHGIRVIPHVSIAMAPQLAAAIAFAAAVPACTMLEFNPAVVDAANRYIEQPIEIKDGLYVVPQGPGLGIHFHENAPWLTPHRS